MTRGQFKVPGSSLFSVLISSPILQRQMKLSWQCQPGSSQETGLTKYFKQRDELQERRGAQKVVVAEPRIKNYLCDQRHVARKIGDVWQGARTM